MSGVKSAPAHTIVVFLLAMLPVAAQDSPQTLTELKGKAQVNATSTLTTDSKNAAALKGKTELRTLPRLARPLANAKADFVIPPKQLNSGTSNLNLKGESLFTRSDFIKTAPKADSVFGTKMVAPISSTITDASAAESKTEESSNTAATARTNAPPARESKPATEQPDDKTSNSKQSSAKKMLIRLKRYRSLSETEVVWEAARTGRRWLKKGAEVTMLLDMDAVHAANKAESANAWYEQNRGNGNTSSGPITSPQDEIAAFVSAGGKLVVSERWAKLGGLGISTLVHGTQLLSEDAIDDLLMDPGYTLISY